MRFRIPYYSLKADIFLDHKNGIAINRNTLANQKCKSFYSKICLKRTTTGPENLSALDRCLPYRGYAIFEKYDQLVLLKYSIYIRLLGDYDSFIDQ